MLNTDTWSLVGGEVLESIGTFGTLDLDGRPAAKRLALTVILALISLELLLPVSAMLKAVTVLFPTVTDLLHQACFLHHDN